MNPLIAPIIQGAIEIYKDKKARKENLGKVSTKLALLPAAITAGTAVGAEQTLEVVVTEVVLALVSLALFLWKEKGKK